MELLHTLKTDGYARVIFQMERERGRVCLHINEMEDEEELWSSLNIAPCRVEYFPLAEHPYLLIFEGNHCMEILLEDQSTPSLL